MANLQDVALKRSEQLWFSPEEIKFKPGLNGRDLTTPDNVAHIEDIAILIAEKGFLESKPLEFFVEDNTKYLSDGHVRHAAVMLCIQRGTASFPKGIPCVREPKGTNEADRILNQSAHNSGKRLTPLEEGLNIKRALAMGLTEAEVAKRLGKSPSYIGQAIAFQAAPAAVHAVVKAGEMSATLAAEIVRNEGAASATETIKEAVKVAKASGKKKATKRHVSRAAQAGTYKVKDAGGGLLTVTIDGKAYKYSERFWIGLAQDILEMTAKIETEECFDDVEAQAAFA